MERASVGPVDNGRCSPSGPQGVRMSQPQPFLGSASGITRQRLRSRRYARLSRDLYVLRERELDLRTRAEAAVLAMPDAVPCLFTAGLLLRLPVDSDDLVHLARSKQAPRSRRSGVQVHRLPVEDDERLDLEGLIVTDGPRTFVDLAAHLDLEQLVAVGDVVARRWSQEALQASVDRRRKRPGLVLARHALTLVDPGADSPAETRARLRLHAAGFTALRHGVTVTDAHGGWIAAPDLADPVAKLAVQHDGLVHFSRDVRRRQQDVQRDELSRQQDWQVVVATALDDRRHGLLVSKVADAYRRAARQLGDGVLPPHLR